MGSLRRAPWHLPRGVCAAFPPGGPINLVKVTHYPLAGPLDSRRAGWHYRSTLLSHVLLGGGVSEPKWRNWQTRCVQVAVGASPCGFESLLRHHFPPSEFSPELACPVYRLPAVAGRQASAALSKGATRRACPACPESVEGSVVEGHWLRNAPPPCGWLGVYARSLGRGVAVAIFPPRQTGTLHEQREQDKELN